MENFKIESRYLKQIQGCYYMYEGFLQTMLSKTLNVSVDQKTRPSICFKTCGRSFAKLSWAFETVGQDFKTPRIKTDRINDTDKIQLKQELYLMLKQRKTAYQWMIWYMQVQNSRTNCLMFWYDLEEMLLLFFLSSVRCIGK